MKKIQVNIYLSHEVNDFLASFSDELGSNKSVVTENLIKEHLMKGSETIDLMREKAIKKEKDRLQNLLNECSEIVLKISKISLKGK